MKITDLSQKAYPVNRKLTPEERQNQLRQKERLDVTPFYNASTNTLNSTFAEVVDRWFIYRGGMTFSTLLCILLLVGLTPLILLITASLGDSVGDDITLMLLMVTSYVALWVVGIWGLTRESFSWTHFPIRFNYRTRMVHVFCLDGVVRSARWDDLFFTLGRCEMTPAGQRWDIRGHALKADKETVEWTFALNGDNVDIRQLKHIWEFVRRYMEEGASAVYRDVYWCQDIATKRETYRAGLNTLYLTLNGLPIYQKVAAPVFWLVALGRQFTMKTSKIPQWPEEIEKACVVDQFDPYQRTPAQNPETFPVDPVSVAWDKV